MLFSSAVFLILFLPMTLLVYYNPFIKNRRFRNIFLLFASLIFYAWGEPFFVFILIISIMFNYFFGRIMDIFDGKKRRLILWLVVLCNLGILFVFKYLTFTLENIRFFFPIKVLEIVLPLGISFYTFQILSYIFDVYYRKIESQKSIFDLGLYAMMFPQLVAGPIVRYQTIKEEISYRKENLDDFGQGIERFIIGLAKKVLIADYLGEFADKIFRISESGGVVAVTAWIGAIAYTLEIYFDFSGYSDMAIGLGRCFGFHYKENFNYPYVASSISEFWKRWHISLTDWFRDYVYIPLGGNRVSKLKHVFNIGIVWLLTGIWHGANWTFVLWGVIYGVVQLIEKYFMKQKKVPVFIGHIYTLLIIAVNWVIFKSSSVRDALCYLGNMFGRNGWIDANSYIYFKSSIVIILIGTLGSMPILKMMETRFSTFVGSRIALIGKYVMLSFMLIFVIMISISGGYSSFIYFNF